MGHRSCYAHRLITTIGSTAHDCFPLFFPQYSAPHDYTELFDNAIWAVVAWVDCLSLVRFYRCVCRLVL